MKSEWRTVALGSVADLTVGFVGTMASNYTETGIPFLRSTNIEPFDIKLDDIKYISSNFNESLRKSELHPNDVVIVRTGTPGACAVIPAGVKAWNCSDLVIVRPHRNKLNPLFLASYVNLASGVINTQLVGAVQQHYNVGAAKKMQIPLPPIGEQDKIASIIGMLNKKITINSKINDNLEQQAQAIFKEWFIENPENNEWSTGTFSELIKTTLNGDWGKEAPTGNNTEKVYCIRGADIPEVKAGNKGKMPTRYILPKNFVKKQLTAGDIVVEISGGSPTQSTGRCTAITQSLLDRYDSGMVCTNFCKAIKPKEGYSLFIYYYWQYLYGKGIFFSYENGTTGIKNLDFSGFIETETILIPPVDKVIAFDDYCKSIFNQIFANGKQNEHLAVLRDTLLPKLMSGELDVSDIDL